MKKRYDFYKLARPFSTTPFYTTIEQLRLIEYLFLDIGIEFERFIHRYSADAHSTYSPLKLDNYYFADRFAGMILGFETNGVKLNNSFIKKGVRVLEVGNYENCDIREELRHIKKNIGKKIVFNRYSGAQAIHDIYFCLGYTGLTLVITKGYSRTCITENKFIELSKKESFADLFNRANQEIKKWLNEDPLPISMAE